MRMIANGKEREWPNRMMAPADEWPSIERQQARREADAARYAWDVYRVATRACWVGRVIASTADEAIEAAAVEFKTDVKS